LLDDEAIIMRILSPTRTTAAFFGLIALLLTCPSCAWYAPAAGERMVLRSAAAYAEPATWPARATHRLDDIIDLAPKMFGIKVRYEELVDGRIVRSSKTLPANVREYGGIYGRGIIRTYRPAVDEAQPGSRIISTGMRFYSGIETTAEEAAAAGDIGSDAEETIATARKPWVVNLRGTWMRLDEPLDGRARGLVVHLTSYGGYHFERPILEELRGRGWAVLWIDSSTVRPETIRIPVDRNDIHLAAGVIAGHIDDRVAEIAYAVEAGLEFVARERPHLPLSPTVITAYSAGALAAPAVVALMPHRFEAAVLVGGGANLLDIAQRSALTNGGLQLEWDGGQPSAADRRRLLQAYLESSRLDPYWTALSLRDKPVLQMHAVLDRIVPAANGDLLYRRLGRPSRINFMLGHGLLFYRLPTQTRIIADWVDDAAAIRRSRRVADGEF
jgi:hypothetical protein